MRSGDAMAQTSPWDGRLQEESVQRKLHSRPSSINCNFLRHMCEVECRHAIVSDKKRAPYESLRA